MDPEVFPEHEATRSQTKAMIREASVHPSNEESELISDNMNDSRETNGPSNDESNSFTHGGSIDLSATVFVNLNSGIEETSRDRGSCHFDKKGSDFKDKIDQVDDNIL